MGSKKWIFRPELGENKLSVVQLIQDEIVNKDYRFYKQCIFKLEMKQQENIVSHECTSKSSNTFKVPFSGTDFWLPSEALYVYKNAKFSLRK